VLQCVAVVATGCTVTLVLQRVAVCCNVPQCAATSGTLTFKSRELFLDAFLIQAASAQSSE